MDGQHQVDRSLRVVPDELRDFQAERLRDLAHDEQGGIACAALQLGQVALRHA